MREKAISFTEAEWTAVGGLPFLQRCLYLVLRWYMDVSTGRVGDRRGISFQSLSEELYVEPVRGRHASECGSPTRKSIRSALEGLEKAGLVQPCGNGEVLVFLLPRARRVSARPKDEGHMRGTGQGHDEGHGKSPAASGVPAHDGHDEGQGVKSDEGHTSEVRVNPLSVDTAAAALPAGDKNLSTGKVLQLLQPADIAEWIRSTERLRGKAVQAVSTDERIVEWVKTGITPQLLQEAYLLAVADRERTKETAAINPGFLDIFVKRVLKRSPVCKGAEGKQGSAAWHTSPEGVRRMAEQLRVDPQREDETEERFRDRVAFAYGQATTPKVGGRRDRR